MDFTNFKMPFAPIYLKGDGKELAKLLGGEFKPYSIPLINSKDIKPIKILNTEKGKFKLSIPKL